MRLQYTLGASALLLFLTACGGPQTARMDTAKPAAAPVAQSAPAQDEMAVSSRIRVARAVSELQAGDADSARKDLEAVLAKEPDHAMAKSLLEQIDADPQALLGSKSFDYTVQVGESLSLLSERYLNDRLKFYALARYNDIAKPNLIAAGEVIRIPGTAPVASADAVNTMPAPAAGPAATPAAAPAMAAATVAAGDCAASIPALEQQVKSAPTDDAKAQLLKCYSKEADALAQAGKYDEAQRTLQKAIMVDRTNTAITQQLVALVSKSRMEELYQKGSDEAAAGKLEEANNTLTELLSKQPDHARAKTLQADVRSKLAARYNSMAMSLYNRQQMDRALALWGRVLELEPQNKEALEYSTKARQATK